MLWTHRSVCPPIPIAVKQDSIRRVSDGSPLANNVRNIDLVIWDKNVMSHRHNLEASKKAFRDVTRPTLPFDGKSALLIGDFRQILPMIRAGGCSQITGGCFNRSLLYFLLTVLHFGENVIVLASNRCQCGSDRFYIPIIFSISARESLNILLLCLFLYFFADLLTNTWRHTSTSSSHIWRITILMRFAYQY